MPTWPKSAAAILALLMCVSPAARADEVVVDLPVDLAITGAGGLAYLLTETVLKADLAPSRCRWCDTSLNGLDDGVRDGLRWSDTGTANTISNVTGFALAPATAFGVLAIAAAVDDRAREWPTDALVVLETAVIAADMNQLVKMLAGRSRPFVRFATSFDPAADHVDDNLSFYSGHSAFSFSLAVGAGTVASLRGYRAAPAIWASGLAVAAFTGYLRIAADRHYFTDVMTGALLGSATGFAVPYFFHRRGAPRVSVSPTMVSFALVW